MGNDHPKKSLMLEMIRHIFFKEAEKILIVLMIQQKVVEMEFMMMFTRVRFLKPVERRVLRRHKLNKNIFHLK